MRRKGILLATLILLVALGAPIRSWALEVGDKAPPFKAASTQGVVQLADYLGKQNVILALYFAAFTPVWTNELIDFQRDLEAFRRSGARIIGVSGDSQETNMKFATENGITYVLVSDKDNAIKNKYGRGRVTYLIDRSGVIRWVQHGVPDNQVFLGKLRELP